MARFDRSPTRGSQPLIGSACGGGGGSDDGGPPYAVSGTMFAAAGSAIDSDTNDPAALFTRNDSAGQAQAIGNPVTLGGHLNEPGAGPAGAPPGRTTAAGDLEDWFRVSIASGQTIRLQIAEDGETNDLDLELRQLDQSLVDEQRDDEPHRGDRGRGLRATTTSSSSSTRASRTTRSRSGRGRRARVRRASPSSFPGRSWCATATIAAGPRARRPGARAPRRDAARLR